MRHVDISSHRQTKVSGRRRLPVELAALALLGSALAFLPGRSQAQVTYSSTATANTLSADSDWSRRATAKGVVKAIGFDTIQQWALYNYDKTSCYSSYQVTVDGKLAGCRTNAWDTSVKTSGAGAVRFDVLSQSGSSAGGSLAIPFGAYDTSQFGANSDLWLAWRQRMTGRYLQGYNATSGGLTYFKQIIISQGDIPISGTTKTITGNACSEAELVVVSSNPADSTPFPVSYIECGRYLHFQQQLSSGTFSGSTSSTLVLSRQNRRFNASNLYNCINFPKGMDQSGCIKYAADQWVTYMVHIKLGPVGTATSSVSKISQPGYINSTYEFYAAPPGQNFKLLHRQTGVVIPKGQYYVGGDASVSTSYKSGWGPANAHPNAKYGKVWLLPYMTDKSASQITTKASTWYDEVIISRCPIAAPGYSVPSDAPTGCQPTALATPSTSTTTVATSATLPSVSEIPAPSSTVPKTAPSGMTGAQLQSAIQALAPRTWLKIPYSEMVRAQVNACRSPSIMDAYARVGTYSVCNPDLAMWQSGGAYDPKRHRLMVWGGGYTSYPGNEIYAFDLATAQWLRIAEPSIPVLEYQYDSNTKTNTFLNPVWQAANTPPAPPSVRSFAQVQYLPDQDKLFATGGQLYSATGYPSALTWLFDLTKADTSGWAQSQRLPTGLYSAYAYAMPTAYDAYSRKLVLRGVNQAGTFDPASGTWRITNASLPTRRIGAVGEIDPQRRLFVVVGAGSAEIYALGNGGELGSPQPLGATGDTGIEQCYAPGLAYDTKIARLVAWCGGGNVYTLDLDTRTWTRRSALTTVVPGDPVATPGIRGTYGRFRYLPEYNAYALINGNRQNVFIYRLSDSTGRIP